MVADRRLPLILVHFHCGKRLLNGIEFRRIRITIFCDDSIPRHPRLLWLDLKRLLDGRDEAKIRHLRMKPDMLGMAEVGGMRDQSDRYRRGIDRTRHADPVGAAMIAIGLVQSLVGEDSAWRNELRHSDKNKSPNY